LGSVKTYGGRDFVTLHSKAGGVKRGEAVALREKMLLALSHLGHDTTEI
jgi:hypothetical protein